MISKNTDRSSVIKDNIYFLTLNDYEVRCKKEKKIIVKINSTVD